MAPYSFKFIAFFASLFLLISLVSAQPGPRLVTRDSKKFTFKNECKYDVYLRSIYADEIKDNIKVAPGKKHQFDTPNPIESAIVKASKSDDQKDPAQFEWSIKDGKLFYDISLIDGDPFVDDGGEIFKVNKGKKCNRQPLKCKKGDKKCKDAYYNPDDRQTWTCTDSFDSFEVVSCKSN